MKLRALYREDDAVSSVLGVVLMVAVTIILAAVIGTFVLGIGSELTDSSPQAQWEFSENLNGSGANNGTVLILHGGGDDVKKSTIEVTIGGTTMYDNAQSQVGGGYTITDNWGDPITTGDRLEIEESGQELNEGDVVRIIWSNGDSSAILADERLG